MTNEKVVHLTDETFLPAIQESKVPVLVDFWAEWCAPCRRIAPVIDELAEDYDGEVLIAKLNVDDNPEITSEFGILSIPTLMIFNNGELVDQLTGLQNKELLAEAIEKQRATV